MATLFVRHRVQDFARWREVYDSVAPIQKQAGVTAESVFQAVDDPADITVTHDFATAEQARAFAESAELREAMGKAGVVGVPTVWFTSKV